MTIRSLLIIVALILAVLAAFTVMPFPALAIAVILVCIALLVGDRRLDGRVALVGLLASLFVSCAGPVDLTVRHSASVVEPAPVYRPHYRPYDPFYADPFYQPRPIVRERVVIRHRHP